MPQISQNKILYATDRDLGFDTIYPNAVEHCYNAPNRRKMVGEKFLRENYWKYLSEVIIMMYHTAKLYSDMGKNVLIDGILVEREEITPHYEQLKEILKDNPLNIVEVYCPLEICRQRNIDRGDRYENQSQEQFELMAADIKYSMRVDTSTRGSTECAEEIVKTLFK